MSKKIIGEKWVYTGVAFALNHPLSQRLGAVWFVVAWLALSAVAVIVGVVMVPWDDLNPEGFTDYAMLSGFILLAVLLFLNDLLGILALIGRHPIARGCVWLNLVTTLPFSLPLILYWADGVKPNLIYAHRFEKYVELNA
ncbi:hypothetical protein [Paracoccus sp. SCSIO 75233]|uniref:hypothetical protein n=1 Tax=Paracoccus sp. SCSIO 75233 TaxID=3017782 RepID=UPI0022F12918|nr:hypothetical protein [Paracoccus sp. SCSIO 75233]WBU53825.1 hypothetical protein PAF12_03010 [Paracoccus sp. SCSIO 75233]